jgi:hypothetical protein
VDNLTRNKIILILFSICFLLAPARATETDAPPVFIEFLGNVISVNRIFPENTAMASCDRSEFGRIEPVLQAGTKELVREMGMLRDKEGLCDWLFYQMVRRASAAIAPKSRDYFLYTVTKWHLLKESGYDPLIAVDKEQILLYVRTGDVVYNLPIKLIDGRQYVCLNFHDYGFRTNPDPGPVTLIGTGSPHSGKDFSFTIDRLPEFPETAYCQRDLAFSFGKRREHLKIRINEALKGYLANYPVTEYSNQFNIPLSRETRSSLIEPLRQKLSTLDTRKGLEYLMQFTRHAFPFATDSEIFGREKRLSPEETLLYEQSDCEDRSALFFCLVKELYDLPMIVLSYPDHVTIAVKVDGPVENAVIHEGEAYTICEPTPQKKELRLGETIPGIHDRPFEISYVYRPTKN